MSSRLLLANGLDAFRLEDGSGLALFEVPSHSIVTLYGAAGTFGELETAETTPTGETFRAVAVPSWEFPAGKSIGFIGVDLETGLVVIPLAETNGGGLPCGEELALATLDLDELDFTLELVPTSLGKLHPHTLVFTGACDVEEKCYGGAAVSDSTPVVIDGVTYWIHNVLFPYNGWPIASDFDVFDAAGIYDAIVVRSLNIAERTFDYDAVRSRTADEFAADTAAGAVAYPEDPDGNDDCLGNEPFRGTKGSAELDTFPNGHVLQGHYFAGPDSVAPNTSGWISVLAPDDDGVLQVVANYQFPLFYDPKGPIPPDPLARPMSFAVRSVNTDPTSDDPEDLRFFVCPDLFAPAALTITSIERTDNLVTVGFAAPHDLGVGMYVKLSGMTGADAGFNDAAFTSLRVPVLEVTSTTYTVRGVGDDVAAHAPAGVPRATRVMGAALVEMSYDSVAKTIRPVSAPVFPDVDQRSMGLVKVTDEGHVIGQYSGNVAFASGPSPLWLKDPETGERSLVTDHPADPDPDVFATQYGEIAEPDFTFGATRGALGFGGLLIDPVSRGIFQARADLRGFLLDLALVEGPNLVTVDPDFDEDPADSWTGFLTVVEGSTDHAFNGSQSMKLRPQGGLTGVTATSIERFPVVVGQSFAGKVRVLVDEPGLQTATLGIRFFGEAGNLLREDTGPIFRATEDGWVEATADFGAPATAIFSEEPDPAVEAELIVKGNQIGAGGIFVDAVRFRRSPALHLPTLDLGKTLLPETGVGVIGAQKGAIDHVRRRILVEISQLGGQPECPAISYPQWLFEIDVAAYLAGFIDPEIIAPTEAELVSSGATSSELAELPPFGELVAAAPTRGEFP